MCIKTDVLKMFYKHCPKCKGRLKVVSNYKVLLGKTFTFLECEKCGWKK